MKRIKKRIFLIIAIGLFVSISGLAQTVLPVPEIEQEFDEWCWAAVSEAIFKFHNISITQTEIADYGTEGVNTWNYLYGSSSSPVRRGINIIFDNWGIPNNYGHYTLTYNDSVNEIAGSNPFIIRWGWDSGGGHFVVCRGTDSGGGTNTLYLMNPWFNEGYSIADYDWVVRGGAHTWTDTLQTEVDTTPTPAPLGGRVFMNPGTVSTSINSPVTINIKVDTDGEELAAYGLIITYPNNLISSPDVIAGSNGFISTVNTGNSGRIEVSGFHTNGIGPGESLKLLEITFNTGSNTGNADIEIIVDSLINSNHISLSHVGDGGTVIISDEIPGDVNGDSKINIIDALMVAQYSVGMNVPINTAVADVNKDGNINVIDALMIAQASVGMIDL